MSEIITNLILSEKGLRGSKPKTDQNPNYPKPKLIQNPNPKTQMFWIGFGIITCLDISIMD